jgi:hypothetical protein
VSFKFAGVENTFFVCFVCFCLSIKKTKYAMLLIEHELHCNYGLHAIGLCNILNISSSLERLYMSELIITWTLA